MDQALIQVGLPVKCRYCGEGGFVRPGTDYDGWYKSKYYSRARYKWYCPKHTEIGRRVDHKFYQASLTPEPEPEPEDVEKELYALLD